MRADSAPAKPRRMCGKGNGGWFCVLEFESKASIGSSMVTTKSFRLPSSDVFTSMNLVAGETTSWHQ